MGGACFDLVCSLELPSVASLFQEISAFFSPSAAFRPTDCRLQYEFLQAALILSSFTLIPLIFQRELHCWSLLRPKDFWVVDSAESSQSMLMLLESCKGTAQPPLLRFPHITLHLHNAGFPLVYYSAIAPELFVIHNLWVTV